jgi:4-amino-4-deoxy-L-arabinose transferase-like glycosyltransferase
MRRALDSDLGLRTTWLAVLLITAIAAGIRFYRLADFPPGLHFDEAFHQVEAINILNGYRPIYFTENMGMDPMHIYAIALLFEIAGVTAIGGRLVSAIAGTLAIPATWWLAQELFWDRRHKRALGMSASLVLATLQWHITFSRTGIQPSLVPLLLALTVASLWRGLRTGHWAWFACSGAFLGAGPYAYSSARVVPLLILGLALWLFLFERKTLRLRWPGLLLCVGVSILVFAPLGYYFLTHWEWFTFRTGQVTFYTLGEGSSGSVRALWENTIKTLASFNLRGDVEMIRNLPGRPALDAFQSALFLLGIGVCLRNIRCPPYATLLGWLGAMSLPTLLTEYAPHFGRSLGVTPALALLVGLGGVTAWQATTRLFAAHQGAPDSNGSHRPRTWQIARWGIGLLLSGGLIASAAGHVYTYFDRWGSQPGLYQAYDVGLLAASREVRARVPEANVYLTPIQMGHPIVRFVNWDRPGARSYDGRHCLVLPPAGERPADYVIVPYLDPHSLERLPQFFPDGEIVAGGGYRDGVPYYQVYRVPAGSEPRLNPQHRVQVAWADQIGLIGYDVDRPGYKPGERVRLTLYWRSLAPTKRALTAFTHLLGPPHPQTGDPVWVGADHEPGRASYPTSAWQPGEVILDEFVLPVPADAPPGEYDLEVGFYQLQTMQRLPVSHADVEAGTDYVILGQIAVDRNP